MKYKHATLEIVCDGEEARDYICEKKGLNAFDFVEVPYPFDTFTHDNSTYPLTEKQNNIINSAIRQLSFVATVTIPTADDFQVVDSLTIQGVRDAFDLAAASKYSVN